MSTPVPVHLLIVKRYFLDSIKLWDIPVVVKTPIDEADVAFRPRIHTHFILNKLLDIQVQ